MCLRLLLIAIPLLCPSSAWAARGSVPPLIQQFDEGYGLVVGTITATQKFAHQDYPEVTLTKLTFKVVEVVAAPITRRAWPLKVGGTFAFADSCGYGGTVENWLNADGVLSSGDPPTGATFLLSIRQADDGSFEHCHGAGAARPLQALADDERADVASVRELAMLRDDRRVTRCRELALEAGARLRLRTEAIRHLQYRCFHAYPPRDDAERDAREAERKATAATLRKAWHDPALPPSLVGAVDRALLQADYRDFHGSAERRDGWIAYLFRPVQAGPRNEALAELRQRPLTLLTDLAKTDPAPVGNVLMKQLADPRWPLEFRIQIASTLAWLDDNGKDTNAVWEAAWRKFIAGTLPDAEGWESRLLLSAIEWRIGASENQQPKRPIAASSDLLDLLRAKKTQLGLKRAQGDADSQYGLAMQTCEKLLAWIDNKQNN